MKLPIYMRTTIFCWLGAIGLLAGCEASTNRETTEPETTEPGTTETRQWLAGDHHIHSRFSVGWDRQEERPSPLAGWDWEGLPPEPIIGGDAIYPTPMNALMARKFGLTWMVTTDHGGPNHSKVNLERAYPELVESRSLVPDLFQFYGIELNSPAADHASIIIPHHPGEADQLFELESGFDRWEAFPADPQRNTEQKMLEALRVMDAMENKPVVISHHPSRSATDLGVYGRYHPAEIRGWNDTAPEIAIGMAGAPGHQAAGLARDGSVTRSNPRGGYGFYPTMGGYDQMTARLGGFWDSLLGEGRRWWITANSDSHVHYSEGGWDFWPGEYSKTYVYSNRNYDNIHAAIRAGKIFVTTGDLVSELYVTVSQGNSIADIGGELQLPGGSTAMVNIRFLDPDGENHRGESPSVRRVDLIIGQVTGVSQDRDLDTNSSTKVIARFTENDWQKDGQYSLISHQLTDIRDAIYIRVRGTNTNEDEPGLDVLLEDPWSDLWFYSNPVFVTPQ